MGPNSSYFAADNAPSVVKAVKIIVDSRLAKSQPPVHIHCLAHSVQLLAEEIINHH